MRALLDRDMAVSCGPKERRGLSNLFFGFISQNNHGKLESSSIMFAHGQFSFSLFPRWEEERTCLCIRIARMQWVCLLSLFPFSITPQGRPRKEKRGKAARTKHSVKWQFLGWGEGYKRGMGYRGLNYHSSTPSGLHVDRCSRDLGNSLGRPSARRAAEASYRRMKSRKAS